MRYSILALLLLAMLPLSANSRSGKKDDGRDDRHYITFTPLSGIVTYGKFNPGAGFDYEYMLSKEYGIGLHIPFMLGYAGPEQSSYNSYNHTTAYTAPGIRFHTGKGNSEVDFMTGPSLLIGNLHFKPTDDSYNNPGFIRTPYDYTMLGLVADNTLNFYRRHFIFGFDVRVGTLLERNDGTRFFIHFGLHLGGKF